MDPIGLVQDALGRARDAIQGVTDLKTSLRRRYGDYSSIIQSLKSKPEVASAYEIERELRQLTERFSKVADLIGDYTAAPADGRLTKFHKKTKRAAEWEDVEKELKEIDADVMRQLAIMNLKGAINSSEMDVLQGVDEKIDRLTTLVDQLHPPSLPEMAAVPAGALALPRSYVERAAVQEVADGLTNPEEPRAPYTVIGLGGGGKSVLASAVVRKSNVTKRFRGGIFWLRVGRGAKNSLLPLLQGLAREMGATPTDAPHGVPHALGSLEQVQHHLNTVASAGSSPRLVVLDDVWEREVVDAFLPLGLKVLLTTRDRSVVDVPTGCLKLGDMTEEEALELLLKTSRTVGQPGDGVRTQMAKVVTLCGRLPLVLAIAGSMPAVNGKGMTAGAWGELIGELENVATKMEACHEGSDSLNVVLETSFNALSSKKKKEFKKTAVLAPGAVASTEMLLSLWETEDTGGTREEAEGLVSKCLLQDAGGGGYRVHDLVLEFVKIKIKVDVELVGKATALQAHFLGRLDVLESYSNPEHGAGSQGLFVLDALWRSVEKLSGDPGLAVASYRTSLGELESCEATADVASSCSSIGSLFEIQGKHFEAEPLFQRSQAIREKVLGPEHPDVAQSLNNRAGSLRAQGEYAEAEPLYGRSQAIREKVLGPEHPDVAESLNDRAALLDSQGKFAEAEPLYERSQAIYEKSLGAEHPHVATTLNNRAASLKSQGKYAEAEPLHEQSQAIREKVLGPEHPDVAQSLNNRAELLRAQGKSAEAEPLYERSQAIREKVLGPGHPNVAQSLNNRAGLLIAQGKYDGAEPLYERATEIWKKALGRDHPTVATVLNNRAGLLIAQGKYDEADPLNLRAIEIGEKTLDTGHPSVATSLNTRAGMLYAQGKYDEAGPLYERSQAIREKALGPEHPDVTQSLNDRARLLSTQGKYAEAQPLFERALAIREGALGVDHPDTITSRAWMADLYQKQGFLDKASPLLEEVVSARERVQGRDHPDVASALNDRAVLLQEQGKFNEAEPLYERSQAIDEKTVGPEHPHVAAALNNRAGLLESQGKYAEADPLYLRAIEIGEKTLGPDHPDLATRLNNRAVLLGKQEKHMEAIPLLEKALSIRMNNKLGGTHPATVSCQNNLEAARQKVHPQPFPAGGGGWSFWRGFFR